MQRRHVFSAVMLLAMAAAPAAAQNTDIRIRVDNQAIREAVDEIRQAMREAFGPDTRIELHRELTDVGRDIGDLAGAIAAATADLTRDLSREIGRDFGRDFRVLFNDSSSQRNFPAAQTDTERRAFTVGANAEFDLENLSGDIEIRAGGGREIIVEITRRARGRTDANAREGLSRVRVETTQRGDRLMARTVYPSGRQENYSVSVDYVVTAPAGTRITARTVSGDVAVTAITGDLSLHTTSGDVDATDTPRLAVAKTVSGDITLRNVSAEGLLQAATMSGDVTATRVRARRIEMGTISGTVTLREADSDDVTLKATSGDLLFDGNLAKGGRYSFTSHSGDVRLALDGVVGFTFEASSFNGTVRTDLPVQLSGIGTGRRPNRNVRGTFGDGSAAVSVTSFSGDVVVTKR